MQNANTDACQLKIGDEVVIICPSNFAEHVAARMNFKVGVVTRIDGDKCMLRLHQTIEDPNRDGIFMDMVRIKTKHCHPVIHVHDDTDE